MALFLAICFSYSNAQQVDSTGNLIDNSQWTGVTYGADPNDCCSNPGGSQPLYDTSSDTIKFSYGQATVGQIIGINNALGSSGLQVHGYTFQYDAKTTSENGSGSDPLTSSSYLKDGSGNVLASTTYEHGVHDWQTFSVSRTLTDPYSISGGGTLGVEFSGKDSGFWAGLYGPEVRNVSIRLNYSVGEDPCVTDPLSSTSCPGYAQAYKDQQCSANPLYDQSCPGYAQAYFDQQCGFNPLYDNACPGRSAVVTSGNLVPRQGSWYREVNQSYAINTALSHGGAGLQVHAFRWGFESFGFSIFGSTPGDFKSDVNIRDSNGNSIYSFSTGWQNAGFGYNDRSYYYQLPQSRNNLTLGTFEYTAEVSGIAAVGNFWARMLYTPDQCALDPLSSVLCTGYEAAFLEQQCSITALFSPQCPGYIDAMNEMLAQSMPTGVEDITQVAVAPTSTVSSTGTPVQDDTKDPTEVTTDVGGVELSTTGEIKVADAVPSAAKESAKQSDAKGDNEEKKTLSKDQLKAIAARAVRETEQTALAAADAAVEQSQSEAANPSDGTGATVDLGGGLSLRSLQAMSLAGQLQAGPERLPDRTSEDDRQRSRQISTAADALQNTINQTVNNDVVIDERDQAVVRDSREDTAELASMSVTPTPPPEPVAPTGPAVRRGGKVEGMEGGADINSLTAAPADFNDYLTQQMTDAQFYASKDIYRGQRNVDNARALRGLGTDRLHQEMVNQQYNQGAR